MKEEFEKELSELSPLLADLRKTHPDDPFKTPKFYFDTLADKVLAQAKAETKPLAPPQYPSLFERVSNWFSIFWQPRIALAFATFAIVAAASWYTFMKPNSTLPNVDLTEMHSTEEDIQTYIQDNIDDFDEEILLGQTTEKAADTEGSKTHPKSGLTEEELEHYLKNNLEETDLDNLDNKL